MECSELITIVKVNNIALSSRDKRDVPKKRKNTVKLGAKYEKE